MKKALSLILVGMMLAAALICAFPASAKASAFSDVEEDRWSAGAIAKASDKGYMLGTGDGLFSPDAPLTRAEAVTVIWRRAGSPDPTSPSPFSDVDPDEWYADACAWARENAIVFGVSDFTFAPYEPVSREQLAAMLFRYSSLCPVSVPERADLTEYYDAKRAAPWAVEPLEWAIEARVLEGTGSAALDPSGGATREQLAAVICRFDETFSLEYNVPVLRSEFTEKDYPLVTDADFYVAVGGSDENDGSFGRPFASFNKAVEAVRGLKDTKDGDITVAFMAGEYGPLSVSLTSEDSGSGNQRITYCKYGDGDVVFDDGFTVEESEFEPLSESDAALFLSRNVGNIKKADISSRLSRFDPLTAMILSEDGMCTLARFPSPYTDGSDQLFRGAVTVDDNHIRVYSNLFKNRMAKYHTLDGIILYGYITLGWYKDLIPTGGYAVDQESGDYIFYIPHPENTRGGHLRFEEWFPVDYYQMAIVNASEELDSKGEYWIDPDTMTFYVYSPTGDYNFTSGDSAMIRMNNADHIEFRGLSFKNTQKEMLTANNSNGVVIEGCSFSGCAGENMVSFTVSTDVVVRDSEFSFAAKGALDVFGTKGSERYYIDTGIRIDNNLFTRTGLVIGNSAAVNISRTSDTRVTHNEFRRCCWEGVNYRGACNMIAEYNVFDEVCCNGDDTGALNNWASFNMCGNVIRHNVFININGGSNGRFCAYLDNTAGTQMYSNLFYNCATPQMNHDICKYNTYENNAEVLSGPGAAYNTYTMEMVDEAIKTGDFTQVTSDEFYLTWKDNLEFFESNPELKAVLEERWPGFFDITTDITKASEAGFCLNNSITAVGNRSFNVPGKPGSYDELISRYSIIEDNLGFTLDENPLFVNPTLGDYRIRDGVDFPDIEFELIGRY